MATVRPVELATDDTAVALLISAIVVLDTPGGGGQGRAQTLTWVAVVDRLLVPVGGGWRVLAALGFVWATVALAALPLRAGKRCRWPGRPPRSACSAASPRP